MVVLGLVVSTQLVLIMSTSVLVLLLGCCSSDCQLRRCVNWGHACGCQPVPLSLGAQLLAQVAQLIELGLPLHQSKLVWAASAFPQLGGAEQCRVGVQVL